MTIDQNQCDVCYKIICKECGWEAGDEEVRAIQQGKLSACPVCQWRPDTSNF